MFKKHWKEFIVGSLGSLVLYLILVVEVDPLAMITALASIFIAFVLINFFLGRGMIGAAGTTKMPELLSFDEIGGQEMARRELKEALDFLVNGDNLKHYGIRPLKGILLTGPPGTGKTLLAKASAHYTDSVFLYASGSDFVEMYVGVGARRVRGLFKEAHQLAKKQKKQSAIIFIDEIDVLGGKRDGTYQAKEADQTLNQLLTEMDGLFSHDPRILMIAATNRKDILDDALLRPGRFDRQIQIDLPDKNGRLQILFIHSQNKPVSVDVQLDLIADQTFGFSGAQLESLMNEAAVYAFREERVTIEQAHLTQAIDKVLLGETNDRRSNETDRRRIAFMNWVTQSLPKLFVLDPLIKFLFPLVVWPWVTFATIRMKISTYIAKRTWKNKLRYLLPAPQLKNYSTENEAQALVRTLIMLCRLLKR